MGAVRPVRRALVHVLQVFCCQLRPPFGLAVNRCRVAYLLAPCSTLSCHLGPVVAVVKLRIPEFKVLFLVIVSQVKDPADCVIANRGNSMQHRVFLLPLSVASTFTPYPTPIPCPMSTFFLKPPLTLLPSLLWQYTCTMSAY